MRFEKVKYVNATKSFPLKFNSKDFDGDDTSSIEDAELYDTEQEVMEDMDRFDFPDTRQVLKIKITYEI